MNNRADYLGPDGYHYVNVDGVAYRADKLAWLYIHGEWLDCDVIHIDGNRSNNAINNLRPARTN